MRKLILILLIFVETVVYPQNVLIRFEKSVVDSIYENALNGYLIVYDSLLHPINIDSLRKRYIQKVYFVGGENYTRPFFEDNLYREGFDGIEIIQKEMVFNTYVYGKNKEYYLFEDIRFNDSDIDQEDSIKEFGFLIPIKPFNTKQTDFSVINGDSNQYRILTCSKGEYWRNSEMLIAGKNYDLDSCSKDYKLFLYENSNFEHSYSGNLNCFDSQMQSNKKIFVEGDSKDFYMYKNKIQGCYIKNPNGKWLIEGNKLYFRSIGGYELFYYEIVNMTHNEIILRKNSYQVKLKKIESH
jgi:hypothetical protein